MQTSTSKSSEPTPADGPDAPSGESGPQGSSEDSVKWFIKADQLSAKQRTAWDGMARAFRFAPPPQRWREILLTVGVLYGLVVGVPVAGGVWAAWRIWVQVRG